MLALDKGENIFLILLDLLAPFDMVNHSLLFSKLQQRCHTCGTVLNRFESYLTQFVKINESYSSKHVLSVGEPQGSVLEPVLYLVYTSPKGVMLLGATIISSVIICMLMMLSFTLLCR